MNANRFRVPLPAIFFVCLLTACGRVAPEPQTHSEPAPVVRTAKLIFIGDVMSHSPQVTAARTPDGYDYTEVFRHVRPLFDSADVVIANLETTLRDHAPYTGYPSFAAPAQLAFAMRDAGIDIATFANNHTCDKGAKGIRATVRLLDSAGIAHTGAFLDSARWSATHPLRFDAGGLKFALFNYTYGTNGVPVPKGMIVNPIDTAMIARDLAAFDRRAADCIIVSYHWGDEYRSQPNKWQRELAAWTRSRGADLVIGGHPHVVQPFEAHYDADSTVVGATYYSLGNFVSNQRRRYTDGGMMAEVTLTKTDSLPIAYDLAYRLFWVYTPYRDGVRRFTVLPVSVADTMLASDSTRWQYTRFLGDTRKLLSTADTVFTELK